MSSEKKEKQEKQAVAGGRARITMADLARLAGVSAITVSRALKNSALVNENTRARIQDLARRHGYALNVSARNLRLRRSHTIAVIVEMAPSAERPMSGAYPLELLGGITQELTAAGYAVLLSARNDELTPTMQSAEGVILLGQGARGEAVSMVDHWQLPTVIWGAVGADSGHVVVGSDNRGGGYSVGRHFVEQGRSRPCFLGNLDYAENAERYEGFAAALAEYDLEPRLVAEVDFTTRAGNQAMDRLLRDDSQNRPDAVFACNDLLAIGAVQAVRDHGLSVPGDVSISGYDDTALGSGMVPALTSVHQDLYQGGVLLARKMLRLVAGEPEHSEVLPTRLVVRAS